MGLCKTVIPLQKNNGCSNGTNTTASVNEAVVFVCVDLQVVDVHEGARICGCCADPDAPRLYPCQLEPQPIQEGALEIHGNPQLPPISLSALAIVHRPSLRLVSYTTNLERTEHHQWASHLSPAKIDANVLPRGITSVSLSFIFSTVYFFPVFL